MARILNAISKVIPYVNMEDAEDKEPALPDSDQGYLTRDGNKKAYQQPDSAQDSTRVTKSETGLCEQTGIEESTAKSVQAASSSGALSPRAASLGPSRPKGHRLSSGSQVEVNSHSVPQAGPYIMRRKAMPNKLSNVSSLTSSGSSLNGRESGADISGVRKEGENTEADHTWSSSMRSNSDPDLRATSEPKDKPDSNKALRTCLKQRARSANTLPYGSMLDKTSSFDVRKLRRRKTVEFEDAVSQPVPSSMIGPNKIRGFSRKEPVKVTRRTPPCPGTAGLNKRSPARPAVTRTDVHVIAITPTSSKLAFQDPSTSRSSREINPATPTMQIVESSNGSYEVIWDDMPTEHSSRINRRSSSASQALEAISSTATRDLERVNTKLAEWSGTRSTPPGYFKPMVVCFPDIDCHRPFESAIADDEGFEILAPPNSEKVSALHSRHPSRPISAPMSRVTSHDALRENESSQDTFLNDSDLRQEQTLVVPSPAAWSTHLIAARRKLGMHSPERKLSNIDEVDVRFRNHRDSVTIAHSRLVRSGGVRPELFEHGDSVSTAKKRLHARNHATSTSKQAQLSDSGTEPTPLQADGDTSGLPPPPVVNAEAFR